jgi:hypothetical protein
VICAAGAGAAAAAVAALNDALQALGMKLTYEPPVSAGRWIVTDDEGKQHQFKVGWGYASAVWVSSRGLCMWAAIAI